MSVQLHDKRAERGSQSVPDFIFSQKRWYFFKWGASTLMSWHLGLFLCANHQQAALEMIFRVLYHTSTLHMRLLRHPTFRNCATSPVFHCFFSSFTILWLYFHHPWSLVLHLWISLQQVYISCPNNYLLENLKDALFSFCEICKDFVLQCTEMNKHWKWIYGCFFLFLLDVNKKHIIKYLVVKAGKLHMNNILNYSHCVTQIEANISE